MLEFLDKKALMFDAARTGNVRTLNILYRQGVDVNVRNYLQQTPLHVAIISSKPDAINFLLERGADRDATDSQGNTPRSLIAAYNKGCAMIVSVAILHAYTLRSSTLTDDVVSEAERLPYRKTDRDDPPSSSPTPKRQR